VGADPEPDDIFAVKLIKSAVSEANSDGVNLVLLINFLEVQSRVRRDFPGTTDTLASRAIASLPEDLHTSPKTDAK
jgi:hypothetical protein